MNRYELRTGMAVRLRDGMYMWVLKDTSTMGRAILLEVGGHSWMSIEEALYIDLTGKTSCAHDVMEVLEPKSDRWLLKLAGYEVVWRREEKIRNNLLGER